MILDIYELYRHMSVGIWNLQFNLLYPVYNNAPFRLISLIMVIGKFVDDECEIIRALENFWMPKGNDCL